MWCVALWTNMAYLLTNCRQWKQSLAGADVSYTLRTLLLEMRHSWNTWNSIHEFSRRLYWKPLERDKLFAPYTSRMRDINANHRTTTFRFMLWPTVVSHYCKFFVEKKTALFLTRIRDNCPLAFRIKCLFTYAELQYVIYWCGTYTKDRAD